MSSWAGRIESLQAWAEERPTRLVLVAVVTFLGAGLSAFIAHFISGDWLLPMLVRTVLAIPFVLLTLAGLLALGAWMAGLSEATWRQRLQMRILPERAQAITGPRRHALQQLAEGRHTASEILAKGRSLAWTAGTMAIPGGLVVLVQAGFFSGTPDATTIVFAAMLPLPLVALVGFIRGLQLVLDGRRLVRDLDPKPVTTRTPKGKTTKAS